MDWNTPSRECSSLKTGQNWNDTERIYTEIHQAIASKYGKVFTWDVKVKCMGKVADEAARTFIDELELPMTVQEYHATFAEICEEMFQKTHVLPGMQLLLCRLFLRKMELPNTCNCYVVI
ncbi:hypothetical protein AVEN_30320-1 [Araneus ventricosus]|uniref:Uncharacterized protein n=1 Tax=Araneus ventricosus TaxID=182803 RepID=A0A4Y2WC44_ARAVE|nr:hypothetical protein AVEN_30320-1 [Araneus ventricosus]